MGEKSAQKKKYILDTARKVFVEKGYKSVTMKDIVEACGISRGGLYLYFDSTEQILLEILQMEAEETDDIFRKILRRGHGSGYSDAFSERAEEGAAAEEYLDDGCI